MISSGSWTYDVFLSFRGEDTRYNFTDHLHNSLIQNGIKTFRDDELRRGEEISPALLNAIQESRISIIVFSQDYASSTWCLDELVKIIEHRESSKQIVWPLFYKVNPSNIRHQSGSFGEAFADHECKFKDDMEKMNRWRRACTEAASLSGWSFWEGYESKFIDKVVEEILKQVMNHTYMDVAKYPVGIETRLQGIGKLLGVGGNDVRMVGIWGTGGIGKTTLAKAVYNSMAHMFEGSCFVADVRERSTPYGGLLELQNVLLSEILIGKELKVTNADKGVNVIRGRLNNKKVLLILDDVNHLDQLNKLAGGCHWFGSGSRIVLTSRDRHLLSAHQVKLIYEVKKLDHHESLKLFTSWNLVSRNVDLDGDYLKLVKTVVDYAQGLPLALMVLGSHLCGKSIDQWKYALDGYRRVPSREIQEILKISYNSLEEEAKEVFLDIACFYKGVSKDYVIRILEGCDLNPKCDIDILVEKAFISITEEGRVQMHDLMEEMGKEIVRQESPSEPGKRSRLWFHKDVCHVLTENTGTSKIKGIQVKLPAESDEICLSANSFSKMKSLRLFLVLRGRLSGEIGYLPNQLRRLRWPECPLESFPANFNPKKLVDLKMPHSRMLRLGLEFQSLKLLNMEGSKFLTGTPDFSGSPNLERLILDYCTSLVELHPSVGFLDKLVKLSLVGCRSLTMFPRIVNLKSLLELNLKGCRSLENFPETVGKMESLTYLDLSKTSIKAVPLSSIQQFISLKRLYLTGCQDLTEVPRSIYDLQHLVEISLSKCSKLVTFPIMLKSVESTTAGSLMTLQREYLAFPELAEFNLGGSRLSKISDILRTLDCMFTLKRLNLSGGNFFSLPVGISNFFNLQELRLYGCKRLREIPALPQNIELLDVGDCVSLEKVSKFSRILKRKESQLISQMNLTKCKRLFDRLASLAEKNSINQVNHFSLLLSSQRNEFEVTFPGTGVPKWFNYRMDLKDLCKCEFSINIPKNFTLENKGFAFCAFLKKTKNTCNFVLLPKLDIETFVIDIYINEGRKANTHATWKDSTKLWLYYIPFPKVMHYTQLLWIDECRKGKRERSWVMPHYLPTCRVHFEPVSKAMESCGVHLVLSTA